MSQLKSWTTESIKALFNLPFADLMYQAQTVHRQNFDPNQVQISTLISVKTGKCPEDCAYCPQSARYETGVKREPLMDLDEVLVAAQKAKASGASRFCMGAGWRGPSKHDLPKVLTFIREVKALGLEVCGSFGLLTAGQAEQMKAAGLDYYNHNLDSSREYYEKIISTRNYDDRLDTLAQVRQAGIKVCCGGIVGMGETREDRCNFLLELTQLPESPESVPINMLIQIEGTPLETQGSIDPIEFVRTVAVARILLPTSFLRLSAGRNEMSDTMQAMAFLAGANSIHYGEKLFVTPLPETEKDMQLFSRLGIKPLVPEGVELETTTA